MPPAPDIRFPDTINKMNKAALTNACDFLHLPSQGTVLVLRNRLVNWARAHRDDFQHDPDYAGFYRTKGVRQQQAPQPIPDGEEEEEDEPNDQSDEEEEDEHPPPPPPSSNHSSSHSSGTRSRRSGSHPSEHDERSVSPERSHSQNSSLSHRRTPSWTSGDDDEPHRRSHNRNDRKGFFNGRPIRRIGTKVIDATGFLIPPKVRKIFEHGWREHVPLSMLTDDACTFVQQISLATSRKDLYTDPTSPTLLSQEVSLNFDQWTQAWERLIKLIKEYVPREYPLWWRHYEFIRTKDTRSSAFPTWLEYDIIVRKRALNESFDPSVFQSNIFDELRTTHVVNKVLDARQRDDHQNRKSSNSSHNNRFSPYPRNRFRNQFPQNTNRDDSNGSRPFYR
ncbi:hypothetical protein CVT24_009885 [Panaeolus cyanescens]|uniref:Uncharacterized protein n=1 Tax=Panaeolus cyanescens TaxID=181874 RepID=A0A409WTY5_9AGAR|nr:hypothetical protein CVT24_009885 [Panaeolus cyanescens]